MANKFLSVLLLSQLSYAREGNDKNCFIYSLGLGCKLTEDTNEIELGDRAVHNNIYF
jgi:hypothetical protein